MLLVRTLHGQLAVLFRSDCMDSYMGKSGWEKANSKEGQNSILSSSYEEDCGCISLMIECKVPATYCLLNRRLYMYRVIMLQFEGVV